MGEHVYTQYPRSRGFTPIRRGASGGPLVDRDGNVLGVSFGASIDDPDTGFVLTANEIEPQLADLTNTAPVATGRERC